MARVVKRVKDLLLDQDNPRIGHVASQPEALEAIIELDERHFKEMMTSVRDHGIDPPYFAKANRLYDNHYKPADHQDVARSLASFEKLAWIVSYDAHSEIERLYAARQFLRYQIGYSARTRSVGTELMFFSDQLEIPQVTGSMIELGRAA